MGKTKLTREELTRYKVPLYTLAAPVRGWSVGPGGRLGSELVIPAGAQAAHITRESCHALLARYGDDRSVCDVIFPDSRYATVFYRLSDAATALPENVQPVAWCSKTQTFEPV